MHRLLTIAFVLSLSGGRVVAQTPTPAADLVRAGLDAMGGEARWRALGSIRVEGIGHEHALEQSERPEGPWLTTYRQFVELRDLAGGRLRRTQEVKGFWQPDWTPVVTVADREAAIVERGGQGRPALPSQQRKALQALELSPERVLLTALAAPDLAGAGDTLLQGVRHRIVAFTWDGRPARLYLNAHTRLPAAVAIPEPTGELFEAIWGDTPTLTIWSLWSLEPGGLLYPRQRDVFRLGYPLESEILFMVALDAPAPMDSFAISAEQRAAFAAGPGFDFFSMRPGEMPGSPAAAEPIELAPGVVTLPGVYGVTWIDQEDGVVVLDATMTSGWSRAVLEAAAERFGGKPVKAVVSTSDAWPHVGGVREFVAAGVPVYALDLNVPLLERLLAAPHRRAPDALARAPRAADLRPVAEPTAIGAGENRIELLPVRGEGGERMMMAWLPGPRILYASDLVQIGPDGSAFWPEYLLEVTRAASRAGIEPRTVLSMHTPPLPWSRLREILDAAGGGAMAEAGEPGGGSVVAAGNPAVDGARVARGEIVKPFVRIDAEGRRSALGALTQWVGPAPSGGPAGLLSVQVFTADAGATVDSAWMSATTLEPIRHRSHNPRRTMALDFEGPRVRGSVVQADGTVEPIDQLLDPPTFDSNIADLVIAALPLAPGYQARIPMYIHERGGRVWYDVEVAGIESIEVGGRQVEAWRVEVDADRPARYWIACDSRRVVRSEYELEDGSRLVAVAER